MQYKLLLLIMLVFSSHIFAEGEMVDPDEKKAKNFMKLQDKEKEIQVLEGVQLDVNKNLSLVKNMNLSMKSKTISITNSTIIKLELHPLFFTKIFLPEGANITNFEPSIPMRSASFKWNRAVIRPNADFIACNIDLTFEYKKNVYDVSIFVEKYDVSKKNTGDNQFFPKIILSLDKPLAPQQVLALYKESYGKLPEKKLTFFKDKDIIYKIEKDDFLDKNPLHEPNIQVIYEGKVIDYKITNGLKDD